MTEPHKELQHIWGETPEGYAARVKARNEPEPRQPPSSVIQHLLFVLIEECSEVQKACTKALRFGLDDTYRANNERGLPKWDLTPRQEIRHELNDVRGTVALLRHYGVLPELDPTDDAEESQKITKVESLMEYAKEQGTL